MKTLIINAHPNFDSVTTYTSQLYQHLVNQYHKMNQENKLTTLTLYNDDIPTITKEFLSMYMKLRTDMALTVVERSLYNRMQELLAQFKEHKRVIIFMPVHNFNIPAKLKDYIDNILVPRETYRYTEHGSVGLMKDGRKALLLQSSGSIYTNNDRYTPLEYGSFYLRSMFVEIMGFDDFQTIRAQGSDVQEADRHIILQTAFAEIDKALPQFTKE